MYSLFDYAFAPQPRIYVVSEERLQQLERDNTERRIEEINVKIERLTEARTTLTESLNLLAPAKDEKVAA